MPQCSRRHVGFRRIQRRVRFHHPDPANLYGVETPDAKEEEGGGIGCIRYRLTVYISLALRRQESLLICFSVGVLLDWYEWACSPNTYTHPGRTSHGSLILWCFGRKIQRPPYHGACG